MSASSSPCPRHHPKLHSAGLGGKLSRRNFLATAAKPGACPGGGRHRKRAIAPWPTRVTAAARCRRRRISPLAACWSWRARGSAARLRMAAARPFVPASKKVQNQ